MVTPAVYTRDPPGRRLARATLWGMLAVSPEYQRCMDNLKRVFISAGSGGDTVYVDSHLMAFNAPMAEDRLVVHVRNEDEGERAMLLDEHLEARGIVYKASDCYSIMEEYRRSFNMMYLVHEGAINAQTMYSVAAHLSTGMQDSGMFAVTLPIGYPGESLVQTKHSRYFPRGRAELGGVTDYRRTYLTPELLHQSQTYAGYLWEELNTQLTLLRGGIALPYGTITHAEPSYSRITSVWSFRRPPHNVVTEKKFRIWIGRRLHRFLEAGVAPEIHILPVTPEGMAAEECRMHDRMAAQEGLGEAWARRLLHGDLLAYYNTMAKREIADASGT